MDISKLYTEYREFKANASNYTFEERQRIRDQFLKELYQDKTNKA